MDFNNSCSVSGMRNSNFRLKSGDLSMNLDHSGAMSPDFREMFADS